MDEVVTRLRSALAEAEAALAEADALVRTAAPRWDGTAGDRFRDAVADDLAVLAAARRETSSAWGAALAHGRAADDARDALLTAAGVAGPGWSWATRRA